jgi:lipoate-protein ligase A
MPLPTAVHILQPNSNDAAARAGYAGEVLLRNIIEIRDETPRSAPLNMALDEVLLCSAREPLLRIYRWERPAVSFGYFGKYSSVTTAWPGREIVRRMTGGGIVPHGTDLTYSLIVPADHAFAAHRPRNVYRAVHETIGALLVRGGEAAALAAPPAGDGTGVCFESPAEFDLVARGRKIAGAALHRTRHGLLLQGSIQKTPDLEILRPLLAGAFAAQAFAEQCTPAQLAAAESLALEKYATPAWTMRF